MFSFPKALKERNGREELVRSLTVLNDLIEFHVRSSLCAPLEAEVIRLLNVLTFNFAQSTGEFSF